MSAITAKLKLVAVDWVQFFLLLLSLGGLAVSAYLMWGYTVDDAVLACGGSHGCDTVKNSIYASFMGVPLPVIGLSTYLVLLILLIGQNQTVTGQKGWSTYIALTIFGISLTGVLYSLYLTYLELFVIYAICRWCVASATIMSAVFFLSLLNLHNRNESFTSER